MRRALLLVTVLTTGLAWAQCSTPVISNLVATATSPTSVTVTWTTDIPSDSLVAWSENEDDGYGYSSGVVDADGVTSHSVVMTNLAPGQGHVADARSRGLNAGVPDDTCRKWAGQFTATPQAIPAGDYDYSFAIRGAQHVVQGYSTYIYWKTFQLSGTEAPVTMTVSNLPTGVTLDGYPSGYTSCGGSGYKGGNVEYFYHMSCAYNFGLKLTTSGATTPGTYTIHFKLVTTGGVPADKDIDWTLTVDPVPSVATGTPTAYPAIPCVDSTSKRMDGSACSKNWVSGFVTYGPSWCVPGSTRNSRPTQSTSSEDGGWYYDGARAYLQIADYATAHGVDLSAWTYTPATCADKWQTAYAKNYVNVTSGITGWHIFPHGAYMGYLRNGDEELKTAVDNMAKNSTYSDLRAGLISQVNLRPLFYMVDANLLDVKLGVDRSAQLTQAVDLLLSSLDQQVISHNTIWVQPFMLGLAMESLEHYYDAGYKSDPRVLYTIKATADWLWENAWNKACNNSGSLQGDTGGFYYNSAQYAVLRCGDAGANMDILNLLIAHAYGWLFKTTGDATYQQRGDEIWQAGVENNVDGISWNGKQFTQNYRSSFDYVQWRSQPAASRKRTLGGGHILGGGHTVQ